MRVGQQRQQVIVLGISGMVVAATIIVFSMPNPWGESGRPESRPWNVLHVAGQASYRTSIHSPWTPLAEDTVVSAGHDVRVNTGGELVLADGGDVVTVDERSYLRLPARTTDGHSGLIQERGRIRYDINSVPQRRFEVDTPHLSITVKGTSFVVNVSDRDIAVGVEHGRVDINTYDGHYSLGIRKGQSIRRSVEAEAPLVLLNHPDAVPIIVPTAPEKTTAQRRPFAQSNFEPMPGPADIGNKAHDFSTEPNGFVDRAPEDQAAMTASDGAAMAVSTIAAAITAIMATSFLAYLIGRIRNREKHAGQGSTSV